MKESIGIDIAGALDFAGRENVEKLLAEARLANRSLHSGDGSGNDFLGWVELPSKITPEELARIEGAAAGLREKAEVVVVIGIGGSYLGAKALLEAFGSSLPQLSSAKPAVVFAGHNLSEDYMAELLGAVKERSLALIVISKSGTTTEPAVAFRLLRAEMERKYGREGAAERIVAVTDASRGALKTLADAEGYASFVIPDDVGGRFSVLTPVGLLPLAVAGINIRELVLGAYDMQQATTPGSEWTSSAEIYAAIRNALYTKGFKVEILASYESRLQYLAEWWKQLYGESEGKEGKGIFPASVTFTSDLHSMGQYIQEGGRMLFETVLSIEDTAPEVRIGGEADDLDGLNFLAGRRLGEVNRMAELGVAIAHGDGGVPNIRITVPRISEYHMGALLYFFEKACGISGYLLGVNPFDQPGVEAYKKNMFALLEKPGYEKETAEIKKRVRKR